MAADRNERYIKRNSLDLKNYGFEEIGDHTYKNNQFFHVYVGEWFVVFSSKKTTQAIDYNDIESFLDQGMDKNTTDQESV